MIQTLRLGTRVTLGDPTWPHIRKQAHTPTHTRYQFTRGTRTVTVDVTHPDTGPATISLPHRPRLTRIEADAIRDHIATDLTRPVWFTHTQTTTG